MSKQEWSAVSGIYAETEIKRGEWDGPFSRRLGLRKLHLQNRYGLIFRSPRVRPLLKATDPKIGQLELVKECVSAPIFDGLIVLHRDTIQHETYASDFGPDCIHSIQSISKTIVNLIAGDLIVKGELDPSKKISEYLSEIGSGYMDATVQQVMDMDVVNSFSEDYTDPEASIGELEEVHGWRFKNNGSEKTMREFIMSIEDSADLRPDRSILYKTANTDVIAWVCDAIAGIDLRESLVLLVEEMGVEHSVYVSCDRVGVQFLGGGLHMTLRDLARYGRLFCDPLAGAAGRKSYLDFTISTAQHGTRYESGIMYRNFLETNGEWVGHLGYGGQYLFVHPQKELVIACLNSQLGENGLQLSQINGLINMCEAISGNFEPK